MTRVALGTLATLTLLSGVVLAGQLPARPAPLGVISGQLVDRDRGGPVRKAQVRLISTTPRMTRTTVSDEEGRFAFLDLPGTEYTLTASRSGYLEMAYGARRPGASSPGSSILLSPGQRIENVSLALPRAGVIAGTVTDEFGDPAFNIPVRAMRLAFVNGERMPQAGGQAVTDDLGAYRIAGLVPGEYLVAAVPRDTVMTAQAQFQDLSARAAVIASGAFEDSQAAVDRMRQATAEGRAPRLPSTIGYVPVYYPGTVQPSEAQRVEVGLSQQILGVDLRLAVIQTATLSGVVTGLDGQPGAVQVQLVNRAAPMAQVGVWFQNAGTGGRFSFVGLVPGNYVVHARRDATGAAATIGTLTGSADVQVNVGETGSVAVSLRPGIQVAGGLGLGAIRVPFDRARVRVSLLAVSGAADAELPLRTATPDAAGRFILRGVVPARYRLEVAGLPSGWHLASAIFNGKDAADHHLVVTHDQRYDGNLTFTTETSELSGALVFALGALRVSQTIVLFPADPDLRVPASRRIRLAPSLAGGRYTISTLPPGEYRVAAVDDLEPNEQFDRAFLEALHARSIAVTLGEGDKRTLDIPVR